MGGSGMEVAFERFRPIISGYLIAVLVSASLWLISGVGWLTRLTSMFERGIQWVTVQTASGVWLFGVPVRTWEMWQTGAQRLAALEERLAKTTVDKTMLLEIQERNRALETALGVASLPTANLTMGKLIALPDAAYIASGTEQGVEPGMAVVDPAGLLVGVVEKSGATISKVTRSFDRGVSIPVRVAGSSTTGVIRGDGKRAILEGVLQADPLNEADILITSGAGGRLPEGIVIGQAGRLTGQPADVTKGAEIVLLADFDGYGFIWRGSEMKP